MQGDFQPLAAARLTLTPLIHCVRTLAIANQGRWGRAGVSLGNSGLTSAARSPAQKTIDVVNE